MNLESCVKPGTSPVLAALVIVAFATLPPAGSGAAGGLDEWYRDWTLEDAISKAHLVMVAKVTNVSQLTVVEGAKTNTVLREYRFQPIRKLKGVYARGELSMTSKDLGCPNEDGTKPPPLAQGEYRLLILARRTGGFGCSAAGPGPLEMTVPRLSDLDDPMVAAAEAIVGVTESRSRQSRAERSIEALQSLKGPASIPVMDCIRRRAIFAARVPAVVKPLVRLAMDESPAVRYAAIDTIRAVLWGEYRHKHDDLRREFAVVLRRFLEMPDQASRARVSAYHALGYLGRTGRDLQWPADLLTEGLRNGQTTQERLAAAGALGHLKHLPSTDAVISALEKLPLDSPYAHVATLASSAIRLNATRAERALIDRLQRSIAAEQSPPAEIQYLASLHSAASLPLMLELAKQRVLADRHHLIAQALVYVGDDRAMPLLTEWVRQRKYAYDALRAIRWLDDGHAAIELRSWLKNEPQITTKLGLAGFLGRHGINDGYPVAIQYVADREISVAAARALGEINDPRTAAELLGVLNSNPDNEWKVGAIAGLLAIGHAAATPALLEILNDDRHPAILHAAQVASLSRNDDVLVPLARLAASRNPKIAATAVNALLEYYELTETNDSVRRVREEVFGFRHPDAGKLPIEVADQLSGVFLDPFIAGNTRSAALRLLRLAPTQRLVATLNEFADQSSQEGTREMARAEEILRAVAP